MGPRFQLGLRLSYFEDVPNYYNADVTRSMKPPSWVVAVWISDINSFIPPSCWSGLLSPVSQVTYCSLKTSRIWASTEQIVCLQSMTSSNIVSTSRWWSFGLLHHVIFWLFTNVSEEHTASIFRAEVQWRCFSETLISTYKSTWRYSPEGQHRHIQDKYLYPRNMK
jgi:hypothetical protein